MNKLKVLVVDDSVRAATMIKDSLEEDEDVEIVGHAKDGVEAIEMIRETSPDVVFSRFDHAENGRPCRIREGEQGTSRNREKAGLYRCHSSDTGKCDANCISVRSILLCTETI